MPMALAAAHVSDLVQGCRYRGWFSGLFSEKAKMSYKVYLICRLIAII